MYDREIRFKIGEREWSDDKLMVCIPRRYADMFEGKHFKNKEHFSRCLMFASCAAEAYYYDRPWIQQRDELSLKEALSFCIE